MWYNWLYNKKKLLSGGGSCKFQPSFRGASNSFVPKVRGGSCVFYLPHFQLLRPTPSPPPPPAILFDQSLIGTYRLSGRAGRENIWPKVMAYGPSRLLPRLSIKDRGSIWWAPVRFCDDNHPFSDVREVLWNRVHDKHQTSGWNLS